jgi:hypothetical protein
MAFPFSSPSKRSTSSSSSSSSESKLKEELGFYGLDQSIDDWKIPKHPQSTIYKSSK